MIIQGKGLADKISLLTTDITKLKVDAIVNAANNALAGGGGVDGAIHRAAGPQLLKECQKLHGCDTGDAKITPGFNLPAKYVIHTVGPQRELPDKLRSCYVRSLMLAEEYNCWTVAFPCISTGVYGYDKRRAAHVALAATRDYLVDKTKENKSPFDKIIFCLHTHDDEVIYKTLLPFYFPGDEERGDLPEIPGFQKPDSAF
ncbi:hypothetical protein BGW37DRAFT_196135 [Umbelopsis sp. PMI_123]|nr:hypothetical protein BGW37DRAFT_196135 [Umbelopsis sp. PMI_123]